MTDKTPRAWDGALEQEFYTPEEIAASDARVGKAQRGIDRAWIIEGLEFTLQESGWDANVAYDQELMIQVVTEAIALLKAQEPRVMTLEEVKMLDSDYYYLESMRSPGKELREIVGAYNLTCVTWPSITWARQTMGDSGYGKTWRCWTSRPDEKRRVETPWGS